jgi:L-2-hydroxyglutarate oxidase LhgO
MTQAPAERVDCVVIGAGVVGLAIARALALLGREVLILEAHNAIGTQTSARNSEVIHAGMYYPTGTLKARLCVRGRELLYAYCAERGIAHQRCGKLIVATNASQLPKLQSIADQGQANGVTDLVWLDAQAAQTMEPALHCVAALHSPSTGIVDSHALMLSLLADVEQAGGVLALNSPLALAECAQAAIKLVAKDGTRLLAKTVINAAGMNAPDLARCFTGLPAQHIPQAWYAKGNYFSLTGKAPFSRLIYPVPEAAGLGVHLTLDQGGQARFGPDVEWVDDPSDLTVRPERADRFYAEIRKYWPNLPDGALLPAYSGVRPKISGPRDAHADFCIQGPKVHGVQGLVNLFGIESPGLTSAVAIGEMVVEILWN